MYVRIVIFDYKIVEIYSGDSYWSHYGHIPLREDVTILAKF